MKQIISIISLLIINLLLNAQTINYSKAKVDWSGGVIVSEGNSSIQIDDNGKAINNETGNSISYSSARDLSYEKSKEKALSAAVNIINDISVDSNTKIKDLILKDRYIRQNITHYLHEYSKFIDQPAGHLNTACRLELKLGYLINTLGLTFPEDDFPARNDIEISTKYSSLIIDTRGLKIKPSLLPAVINESGLEIYNRNNISGKDAVNHLAVSYTNSEADAVKHKKAGKHPYFCTALKSFNGNPVISDEDVKRIYSHKENLAFLKKCRVIFIIDR